MSTAECEVCKGPVTLVQDERTGRAGVSCRDSSCAGYRYLHTPERPRRTDVPDLRSSEQMPDVEIHVRAVNGDGQRCGCGQRSALRVHVGALRDGVTPEDVFLCRSCTFEATEGFIARTGQARHGDAATEEYRRA